MYIHTHDHHRVINSPRGPHFTLSLYNRQIVFFLPSSYSPYLSTLPETVAGRPKCQFISCKVAEAALRPPLAHRCILIVGLRALLPLAVAAARTQVARNTAAVAPCHPCCSSAEASAVARIDVAVERTEAAAAVAFFYPPDYSPFPSSQDSGHPPASQH
jgi:hypothetical protein